LKSLSIVCKDKVKDSSLNYDLCPKICGKNKQIKEGGSNRTHGY
jgi:hypothetical protein